MIRVLEDLPEELEIDGQSYPIVTGFRDWMRFELMLFDPDLSDEEKVTGMLDWYLELPENLPEAVRQLLWFFGCGRDSGEGEENLAQNNGQILYDLRRDAEMIFASFWEGYGIRLSRAQLHWWEFRALLSHIPAETALARAMGYRGADEAGLSARQRELKKFYDLGRRNRAKTLEERDKELIERARKARERALAVDSVRPLRQDAEDQ